MKADWLPLAEARDLVVSSMAVLPGEESPLRAAAGRVLTEDLRSPIDLPMWTNSAMDGFAVHAKDIAGASAERPVELRVVESIAAGGFPRGSLHRGCAARVMTGAPVPEGADSVVRVEQTDGGGGPGSDSVRIFSDQDAGRHLRRRGEELTRGAVALPKGSVMTPGAIGVAASIGFVSVPVVRRPLVAVLTSGDELVEVEEFEQVLEGRKIVSSNTHTLAAQLAETGCEVRYLGIAEDSPRSLRAALSRARGCDALITSAGISVGEHDHIRSVLAELRTAIRFWRVRIRPGSPFAFGTVGALGGIPWFGLPGNPVSSMVTFELFARPALLRMSGRRAVHRRTARAVLLTDHIAPAGLTELLRVRLTPTAEGGWTAEPTGPQGSGILSSLAAADGLLVVPEDRTGAKAGETFSVVPLSSPVLVEDAGF
jgi:molybdopterin molybdotransferase